MKLPERPLKEGALLDLEIKLGEISKRIRSGKAMTSDCKSRIDIRHIIIKEIGRGK